MGLVAHLWCQKNGVRTEMVPESKPKLETPVTPVVSAKEKEYAEISAYLETALEEGEDELLNLIYREIINLLLQHRGFIGLHSFIGV